jgi:hypothetical protein
VLIMVRIEDKNGEACRREEADEAGSRSRKWEAAEEEGSRQQIADSR